VSLQCRGCYKRGGRVRSLDRRQSWSEVANVAFASPTHRVIETYTSHQIHWIFKWRSVKTPSAEAYLAPAAAPFLSLRHWSSPRGLSFLPSTQVIEVIRWINAQMMWRRCELKSLRRDAHSTVSQWDDK
jgi:hypothetical protein